LSTKLASFSMLLCPRSPRGCCCVRAGRPRKPLIACEGARSSPFPPSRERIRGRRIAGNCVVVGVAG
jgi:hypothetical protein